MVLGLKPVGMRFSAPVHTGPWAHPAFYATGTGSFPGVKWLGRGVDHPPHLLPRLKSAAITLLHLWAFVACYRVNCTFTFILRKQDTEWQTFLIWITVGSFGIDWFVKVGYLIRRTLVLRNVGWFIV
jgi:hypothetical protein